MMKRLSLLVALAASAVWFGGCAGTKSRLGGRYDSPAYRPQNPNNVKVKVSLANRAVYVMEGDRPLLVTATAIGTPSHPTPTGNFKIYKKIEKKRSYTYGFSVEGDRIRPAKSSEAS